MVDTPNVGLALPDEEDNIDDEIYRLRDNLLLLDALLGSLQAAVAGKANAVHTHTMAQINGLVDALNAKMAANKTFALNDLTDVIGASGAPAGYLLVKQSDGSYQFVSAAAAIGSHQHVVADIIDFTTAVSAMIAPLTAGAPADLNTFAELAAAIANDPLFGSKVFFKSGGKITGDVDLSGNALKNVGSGVPNYVKGLITSKTAAFTISVGAGEIKGNGRLVINAAAFTKNLNAVWAPGSGNGGRLDAAPVAANTTYHLQAFHKDGGDVNAIEFGFSLAPIPATVPAGYTWVSRLWSVYTTAAGTAIVDYTQVGDVCHTAEVSWFSTSVSFASALYTLPVGVPLPAGIKVKARITVATSTNTGSDAATVVYDADGFPYGNPAVYTYAGNGGPAARAYAVGFVTSSTLRQLGAAVSLTGTGTGNAYVGGWEDFTLNRIY